MSKVIDNIEDIASIDNHIGLSGITAYHLLQGNLAVDNTVTTQGFNTTLYTGNGGTQSINTGIDFATQWGNDVSEQFGGLAWLKSRSVAANNFLFDTVRGVQKRIQTNETASESTSTIGLSSFNNNGFTLGSDSGWNGSATTYASWNFQTTHRVSGTTNHGKSYTCHFNPFTGFTIVKYEGSGIAGHEIPHHLGRKLDIAVSKNLTVADGWGVVTQTINNGSLITLNGTSGIFTSSDFTDNPSKNIDTYITGSSQISNKSGNQHILYGWANSYIDESNKLIGNYEVGVYQGTGASGNKVVTRGKPAWVMMKRLDADSGWIIFDNQRGDKFLFANSSDAETTSDLIDIINDGFTFSTSNINASGGQYLYMVAYDTNSNGGGSYYPRATDTSNLNISNAIIPYANGVDGNGSKITTLSKNETISGLTLTAGKNYVYSKNDGTYGVSKYAPCYGLVPTRTKAGETPDFFDIVKNKWFTTTGGSELVTNGTFDSNTSGWTAQNATISQSNGTMIVQNTASFGRAYTSITTVIGKKYKLLVAGNGDADSNLVIEINTSIPIVGKENNNNGGIKVSSLASFASISYSFVANNTTLYVSVAPSGEGSAGYAQVDNISVFEAEPTIGTEITSSRNYLNHIVYADNDGSPLYVEELPKIEYKDVIKANEYRGKNACTAWVNFDGTTTPPAIRDSYNISSVVRVSAGVYDVYFATSMDNVNYGICGSVGDSSGTASNSWLSSGSNTGGFGNTIIKKTVSTPYATGSLANFTHIAVQIFGGKN